MEKKEKQEQARKEKCVVEKTKQPKNDKKTSKEKTTETASSTDVSSFMSLANWVLYGTVQLISGLKYVQTSHYVRHNTRPTQTIAKKRKEMKADE